MAVCLAVIVGASAPFAAEGDYDLGRFIDDQSLRVRTLVLEESVNRGVSGVVRRVGAAAGLAADSLTVRVVHDPSIGAVATSSGFVYVHSGLLDAVETNDELAAIVAHELDHMIHADFSRGVTTLSRKAAAAGVGASAGAILLFFLGGAVPIPTPSGKPGFRYDDPLLQTYFLSERLGGKTGTQFLNATIFGYDEARELRADQNAIRYLRKAGFQEQALYRVLARLAEAKRQAELSPSQQSVATINAMPGLERRLKALAPAGREGKE